MKHLWNTLKVKTVKAFTLIEMLMVLVIIAVLMLLFVPNLTKQKAQVEKTGNAAVVKVVESQAELYEMNKNQKATLSTLQSEGYITDKQVEAYHAHFNNGGEGTQISD